MNCPLCNADSKVMVSAGDKLIKRRRQCVNCKHRWNTVEITGREHDSLLASDATIQEAVKRHLARA